MRSYWMVASETDARIELREVPLPEPGPTQVLVPEGLSWEEAGSLPTTYMVAHDMLVLQGGLKAGGWLLVTGVTAGVSVAALQIAKALGAKVIGTSGSREKLDRLAPLGLDVVICTRRPDFQPQVMDATGGAGMRSAWCCSACRRR